MIALKELMINCLLLQKQYLDVDCSESELSTSERRRPQAVASASKHSTHSKKSSRGTRLNQANLPNIDACKDRVCALD